MISRTIEPATFRFVAQWLNKLRYSVPLNIKQYRNKMLFIIEYRKLLQRYSKSQFTNVSALGAHTSSYLMVTGDTFLGGKAAGTYS
jgi:hypothetical protein